MEAAFKNLTEDPVGNLNWGSLMTRTEKNLGRLVAFGLLFVALELAVIGGAVHSTGHLLVRDGGASVLINSAKTVGKTAVTLLSIAGKIVGALLTGSDQEEGNGVHMLRVNVDSSWSLDQLQHGDIVEIIIHEEV